jgi:hypothetical protein
MVDRRKRYPESISEIFYHVDFGSQPQTSQIAGDFSEYSSDNLCYTTENIHQ